jgi:hypothetical protein
MLALVAVVFAGCKKDNDPAEVKAPVITMPGTITIDYQDLDALKVDVAVNSADEDLTSVKVYAQVGEGATAFKYDMESITDFGTTPRGWAKTYSKESFSVEMLEALKGFQDQKLALCIEAKTATQTVDKSATIELKGIEPPNHPLEGPKDFTWNRKGTADGTGLAEFGLAWKANTTTHLVITPLTGAKLVELRVEDWTLITTKEDLAAAVEAGTGLTKWEVIPTKTTFNHVIATKTDKGEYFLLNPTERTINPSDPGDRTVTGKYKY